MSSTSHAVDPAHYTIPVAAGSAVVKRHSARMHVLREPSGAIKWAPVRRGQLKAANPGAAAAMGYAAQIAKTTDAGK